MRCLPHYIASWRVSNKSLRPEQYRAVRGQPYGPARLVESRFFGFAQNDRMTIVFRHPLRGCLKRVQSSRRSDVGQALRVMNHEARIISQRPKRPGMATAGTTVAPSQTWRPANQVLPTGGSQRYPLCAAHRVRVADAPPRSAPMAYHVPLLPHVATGWELGAGPCGPA